MLREILGWCKRNVFGLIGRAWRPYIDFTHTERHLVQILSIQGKHVLFGYYDICPFNDDCTKLLAVCIDHPLKTPRGGSKIDIGYFDLTEQGRVKIDLSKIGESWAWCWQQGCRLQWYPKKGSTDDIFYNSIESDRYVGVIQNTLTKRILKKTSVPLYEISNCGQKGLTLNFHRLQRFRPGYGYSIRFDDGAFENVPENDGIFFYDFYSDKSELMISFDDIVRKGNMPKGWANCSHYINHLSFNPSGNRFIFLHLLERAGRRFSRLFVCRTDGSELKILNNTGKVSHYGWKDDSNLLNFCQPDSDKKMCYVLYNVETGNYTKIAANDLVRDGHPTYLQKSNTLLTDTYPNLFGYQSLIIYDLDHSRFLFRKYFFRSGKFAKEVRIDLHPRLSPNEKIVCIDDEWKGHRAIKLINIEKIK